MAGALDLLRAAGLPERVVVDASHANSGKDHRNQPMVAADVAAQLAAGQRGIVGIMLESFLQPGRQDLDPTRELEYGKSVTDACIGWDTTAEVLTDLATAVRTRRATLPTPA